MTRTAPGRSAAWRLAQRYVAGVTAEDAMRVSQELASHGFAGSIDLFGERTQAVGHADAVADRYVKLARRLSECPPGTWLSLDLSHLALARDPVGARQRLDRILAALPPGARLQIGAEEEALADGILDAVCGADERSRLSATVQANLRRSPEDAERLTEAGVAIRLVKGAYVEPATVALAYGEPTDLAYLALARQLAADGAETFLATHDSVLREACRVVLPDSPVEMLLGVRPDLARTLAAEGTAVRIYIPYGSQWFRYVMRRVAEARGA